VTNIRLIVFCALALTAFARLASACSCAERPVCASFWEADRVFTGRAEVTSLGPGAQRVRFRVEEAFRGSGGTVEIVSRGIGGSCAYAFVHGTRYLVFARRGPDGTWSAFFCDPTKPLDQAGRELAFARAVAGGSLGGGRVFGSVLVAGRAGDGQLELPAAQSGVTLTLRGAARTDSAVTDANGQYEIKDLTPGRYSLTVRTPADVEPVSPVTIEIGGPGACVSHVVTAVRKRGRPPR